MRCRVAIGNQWCGWTAALLAPPHGPLTHALPGIILFQWYSTRTNYFLHISRSTDGRTYDELEDSNQSKLNRCIELGTQRETASYFTFWRRSLPRKVLIDGCVRRWRTDRCCLRTHALALDWVIFSRARTLARSKHMYVRLPKKAERGFRA
jgi:hypothetical protein